MRAVLALARAPGGRLLSVRRIAEEMAIPVRFLPQVMSDLVAAGLVEATTGRAGGYRLARPADAISLLDVVEAVEGDSRRRTCVLRGGPCGLDGFCDVHDVFFEAQDAMLNALAAARIAELPVRRGGQPPGRGAGRRPSGRVTSRGRPRPAPRRVRRRACSGGPPGPIGRHPGARWRRGVAAPEWRQRDAGRSARAVPPIGSIDNTN